MTLEKLKQLKDYINQFKQGLISDTELILCLQLTNDEVDYVIIHHRIDEVFNSPK